MKNKIVIIKSGKTQMNVKKFYNVAIYLRLSRDNEDIDDKKAESNSIRSQRDMICSYIRKQEDMEIYDVYVDDGWSGTNFNRPEFKRMMRDIENGNVNCVIVKDLSRLGRDYIEAGRLIQKTFPAFSVRFIALTDNFDSLIADYNEISMVVPVKNFVNDAYARDISNKVKSHLKIKREKGECVSAFTPYGYRKSEEDYHKLVPDEYAADIVRKIFAWKIEGYTHLGIAEMLEKNGILSPSEYKKMRGISFSCGFGKGTKAKWSSVAVKRILMNEVYIGNMVQGKERYVNYKVKKVVKKPKEEWIKVEGTHEAIISKEDFEMVQDLLKVNICVEKGKKKSHMYAGILFCGDCKKIMTHRVERYKGSTKETFVCSTRHSGEGCTRHRMIKEDLDHLVLTTLRQQIDLLLEKSKVLSQLEDMEIHFEEVVSFDKEIKTLYAEQDKYLLLQTGLYEDLKQKIITEAEFKSFREIYKKRYQEIQETIANQEDILKQLFQSGVAASMNLERMKRMMQVVELDRMTLITFVKRIDIYEDKHIHIELRHKELFSKVIMLADYVEYRQTIPHFKCVEHV